MFTRSPHDPRRAGRPPRFALLPLALKLLLAVGCLAPLASAPALELRGSTYFVRAPDQAKLVSYYTSVWEATPEHYITVVMPDGAGADLGGLTIEQIRGSDTDFPYDVSRTRAFFGLPRHEGPAVPVQAAFDQGVRRFTLTFPEPVAPGRTLTVVLMPWRNPGTADTYLFQVTAYPAGPSPVASPVGVAVLRIYERFPF
jgi:hypothetical protein